MRLLLDEDSQGKPDADVLAFAQSENRVLLTRNAKDFEELHQASSDHQGILVEYQDSDPTKNMTYLQIADAIGKIEASGWPLEGEFCSINPWR